MSGIKTTTGPIVHHQHGLQFDGVDDDARRNFDREFLARCKAAQVKEWERELVRPLLAAGIQERIEGLPPAPDAGGQFGLF